MSVPKGRVKIPRNAEELISLGSSIFNKHTTDGANSPLNSLTDYKWETEGPKLASALEKHKEAEDLRKKMETAYGQRDLLLANIPGIVRASRDVLLGINSQNPKRLGDWGFVVDSTPRTSKAEDSNEKKG